MRFLKDIFFTLASQRLPEDRAVILMYHSVSEWKHFTTVSPQVFAAQMQYLADRKYPVISLAELVRRLKNEEPLGRAVVITFDDGYQDNLTTAYPMLKQYNFPATVFATTDWIGTNEEVACMTKDELRQLQATGLVDIEPHSTSHPHLSKLSPVEAQNEILASKSLLEELLGKPCPHFAAPYGDYSPATLSELRRAGIGAAVTVREGTVGPQSAPLELPRVSIDSSTSMAQFKGKLSTAIDWYERLKIWR